MTSILLLILEIVVLVMCAMVMYLLARPIMRGAIYFPTSSRNIDVILGFAKIVSGQRVVDLGSGDGRILIAAAQQGAFATGYEINPLLVWKSRRAIAKAGMANQATVIWKSFWRVDFSEFDTVIVYGIPYIMDQLQRKLERELKPGSTVISNIYKFPGWEPRFKEEGVRVYGDNFFRK